MLPSAVWLLNARATQEGSGEGQRALGGWAGEEGEGGKGLPPRARSASTSWLMLSELLWARKFTAVSRPVGSSLQQSGSAC